MKKYNKLLIYYNYLILVIIFLIIFSLSSCTNYNLDEVKQDARFLDFDNKEIINLTSKIKLSTTYVENNIRICIYIDNNTKKIIETSENNDCPAEI